jgi:hypothetical protein
MTLLCVLGFTSSARADKKIQELIPGLERESTSCQTQVRGLTKVAGGAAALAKLAGADKAELEADADRLAKGLVSYSEYCTDVGAFVAFLKDSSNAAYRTVEKEIDARDNKVRKLRRDAKKLMEELEPITRKMIPRMTRIATTPVPEIKSTPGKFPSGRVVELPNLPGQWRLGGTAATDTASYDDKKLSASVTTRPFTGATCEQQRKAIDGKQPPEQLVDVDVPKEAGTAWAIRYVRREKAGGAHGITTLCVQRGTGGVLAIADVTPETAPVVADMTKLALRMLAAQTPKN